MLRGLPLVALALVVVALWCLPRPRPSVVLITIDTLRPDRLGCYGHPKNRTPGIDRLAREGAFFERAYCDMPWTTGSMASVMTGQYSSQHGVRLPINKLEPKAVTMAELLGARGFQTGAVIGSFPLDSVYGLDQGFETYDDEFSMPMIAVPGAPVARIESQLPEDREEQAAFIVEKFKNDAYRPDEAVTDAAIHWLEAKRDGRPFFLWVHYFGPHEKLRGDVSFLSQEPDIVAAYDPDVAATDRAVGRLLDRLRALQILDDAVVILHADHGQNLGEHDYVGHSQRLDEESVRIPLIVRYPRLIPGGVRRDDIARNIDILPTVLDVLATNAKETAGRSLLALRTHPRGLRVPADEEIAYCETYVPTIVFVPLMTRELGTVLGPMQRLGVRTPGWKLLTDEMVGACVRGGAPRRDPFGSWSLQDPVAVEAERCREIRTIELYRQSEPPESGLQLSADPPADVVAELLAEIRRHGAQNAVDAGEKFTLSPEQERKLRGLGYLR